MKTEKIYHIYAKDKCLFHSIKEDDFHMTWNTIRNMVELIETEYSIHDLSYEEVCTNPVLVQDSSY
jgi:hypothetical protein